MFTNAMIALPALSMFTMLRGGFDWYTASKGAGFLILLVMMLKSAFNAAVEAIIPHLHELDAYELFRIAFVYFY